MTQCPRCHRFADKYVEHDFVVLFIDLVLIKPQVLLSNHGYEKKTERSERSTDTSYSTGSGEKMIDSMYEYPLRKTILKNAN